MYKMAITHGYILWCYINVHKNYFFRYVYTQKRGLPTSSFEYHIKRYFARFLVYCIGSCSYGSNIGFVAVCGLLQVFHIRRQAQGVV